MRAASVVRDRLACEFPSNPRLVRQCKRAAILLDLALRELGLGRYTYPTAGWVHHVDREAGHVWNVVSFDGTRYILDVALTQFKPLLKRSVPEIVWGPAREVAAEYKYIPDGRGRYRYDRMDIRPDLVEAVVREVRS